MKVSGGSKWSLELNTIVEEPPLFLVGLWKERKKGIVFALVMIAFLLGVVYGLFVKDGGVWQWLTW